MTAKDYLSRYINLINKCDELRQDILLLEDSYENVKSTSDFSEGIISTHGKCVSITEKKALPVADARIKLVHLEEQAYKSKIELLTMLNKLQNSYSAIILYKKYICCMADEDIAEYGRQTKYAPKTRTGVKNGLKKATQEFSELLKPEGII